MGLHVGKCVYGFHRLDIVRTPTGRRAQLQKHRTTDGYWLARYVTAITGEADGEEVILNPKLIRPE